MVLIAFVAAIGGFLFGYDLQIVSGAILYLRDYFELETGSEAIAMASALIGCLFGPYLGSLLADSAVGRKWCLLVAALLFLVSALGTALPQNMTQFNVFRFVGGIGVGLASVASPMYIAEVSPARIRGALVLTYQWMIVVGSFVASLISFWFAKAATDPSYWLSGVITEENTWRWMFGSEGIPVILLMLGVLILPRSPRWLVQRGRQDEARELLTRFDGPANADKEINDIVAQLGQEQGSWRELFGPGIRVALLIAFALAVFQQWTGVSPSTFYAPTIFEMAGFEKADAIKQLVIANVFNIICTTFALLTVDRLGRRRLLLWSLAGMAVGQIFFGAAFHFHAPGVVVLLGYLFGFGFYLIGLAPLGWLIMSEVFPIRVRAKGMALASFGVWIASFSSVYGLRYFLAWTAEKTGSPGPVFWAFSVICVFAWLFSYKMVPETKGKTLEEIGDFFLKIEKRQ